MADNKFKLGAKLRQLEGLKSTLPTVIGNMAKNHFVDNFKRGGFLNVGIEKWKPRKGGKRNNGRAVLVDTGDLRRSIRVKNTSFSQIKIGSDLVYAAVHNSGGRAGRGKGFKMPQRKFIGHSGKLATDLKKKCIKELDNILG